jgi:tRNA(fMet)-specific endonuclease VapC
MLDADVVIGGERGAFQLHRWMALRPQDEFEIAAITVAELWHGVERGAGAQRARREAFLKALLGELPTLPYTEGTAYVHARLWAKLKSSGKMIGAYDLIVAAIAVERGSELATFNRRHFAAIPELRIIEPS